MDKTVFSLISSAIFILSMALMAALIVLEVSRMRPRRREQQELLETAKEILATLRRWQHR